MTAIELWYNPKCSKSRRAQAILDEAGVEYSLYAYLDERPDRGRLEELLSRLDVADPATIVRSKEAAYAERDLANADRDALLTALSEEPRLIERPIAIRGNRAVIARPPERIRDILD